MVGAEDDNDMLKYTYELELPYGEWKYSFWFKLIESDERKEIPQ
jgi:hypothetical protein